MVSKNNRRDPSNESPLPSQNPLNEYAALNKLIHDRSARWSNHARAIKFDIEFKAIEEERRRVAKELHDEILPLLARLIRSIRLQNEKESNCTGAIVNELHATVAAFRDLLGELHAVDLEELGLVSALSNLCQRYSRFTERSVVFIEQSEECNLSEHQQLCLYRAMQTMLKMFEESDNDILLVTCNRTTSGTILSARCVDKRVSSNDWLLAHQEFSTLESWCVMAGAELTLESKQFHGDEFPCDLVIVAPEAHVHREDAGTLLGQLGEDSQVRLRELDDIIATAQEEWKDVINRDCALFKKLTVELERKRITEDINKLILPHLEKIIQLANKSKELLVRREVKQRMQVIAAGVNGVILELHPRLIDEVGLVASIRTLVARFRHATLIDTTMISNLWSDHFEAIPVSTKFALYRVAQEALNNIEKHSDATRSLIIVTKNAEHLVICIEDNGKGFQQTGTSTLSRGLRIIRERASTIGAYIAIEESTSFDTGTLVTISLPCPGLTIDNQSYKPAGSRRSQVAAL